METRAQTKVEFTANCYNAISYARASRLWRPTVAEARPECEGCMENIAPVDGILAALVGPEPNLYPKGDSNDSSLGTQVEVSGDRICNSQVSGLVARMV